MKYFLGAISMILLHACADHSRVVLRMVNDQNDGWNAFSIVLMDNNTYRATGITPEKSGRYTISRDTIYLDGNGSYDGKILFKKNALDCLFRIQYYDGQRVTDMRIILDSLFCHNITRQQVTGKWKYPNDSFDFDTLQLNSNGTAEWKGIQYASWDISGPELSLVVNNQASTVLI